MKTIGAIIFSYNRPKMLEQAIASAILNRADEIIVCDDGSENITPAEIQKLLDAARGNGIPCSLISAKSRPPEERLHVSRAPDLGNKAIDLIQTQYIAFLCDDDMFAPGWFDHVRSLPDRPLYIGDVLFFTVVPEDGVSWMTFTHHPSHMTTGCFIYEKTLGPRWMDHRPHGQDAFFVMDTLSLANVHPQAVLEDVTALHFRNHPNSLSNVLKRDGKDDRLAQFKKETME